VLRSPSSWEVVDVPRECFVKIEDELVKEHLRGIGLEKATFLMTDRRKNVLETLSVMTREGRVRCGRHSSGLYHPQCEEAEMDSCFGGRKSSGVLKMRVGLKRAG
jgi:hypothetical protein